MSAMKWWHPVTLVAMTALLLSACDNNSGKVDDPPGQAIEVMAGGGSDPAATRALDTKLTGTIEDIEVAADGVVRLLVTEATGRSIVAISPAGQVQRIKLTTRERGANQLAVADDGSLYVSFTGDGGVFRVSAAGELARVVGNGMRGFTPDGGLATGPAGPTLGITVDHQGRLIYSEVVTTSVTGHPVFLLRRIETNGRIKTIAGDRTPVTDDDAYIRGEQRTVAPPPGTKALGWPMLGIAQLASLAVDGDGTIYAQCENGVLAFPTDGTVHAAARQRDRSAAPVANHPFTDEGDAADAAPNFGTNGGITADDGYVTMTVRSDTNGPRPPAYRWAGDHTPGQQAILDAVSPEFIVRLVTPNGRLTTAAWSVYASAVRGNWLYVLVNKNTGPGANEYLIGRTKLPTG